MMVRINLTRAAMTAGLLLACSASAAETQERVARADSAILAVQTAELLAGVMQFFQHDALATRSAGTPGGGAAAAFLAAQLTVLGLEPAAADGSFFQRFDAFRVSSEGTLVVGGSGRTESVAIGTELLAWPLKSEETVAADGELVFVGYGIRAPEYGWNDFGDIPLDGRILVALSGDPGVVDTSRFAGDAGTPYALIGTKLAEAARMGAHGFILLHDTLRAGQSWADLARSRSGPIALNAGRPADELDFAAVMPLTQFSDLMATFGRDAAVLVRRSGLPSFQPIPLGMHAVMRLRSEIEPVSGMNVLARVPGREATSAHDAVLALTSYDATTTGHEASIAALLAAAGSVQSREPRPARSVYFAFTAGSVPQQIGASAIVAEPPVPLERVTAVVGVGQPANSPGFTAVAGIDASEAGLAQLLAAAAMQHGVAVAQWPGSAMDRLSAPHMLFAREGVPGLTLGAGLGERPPAHASIPSLDDLTVRAAVLGRLILLIADAQDRPEWSSESVYRPAWERLERRRLRGVGP